MSEYIIRNTAVALPDLTGKAFDPESCAFCAAADCAPIASHVWPEFAAYQPEARAYVAFENGDLKVLLCAKEETIRAEETRCGGAVCVDSCLEFFFMPFPEKDQRYLNIESNAAGTVHIGLGAGRPDRKVWTELPEGFSITASKHEGAWWAVAYTVPASFLKEIFGEALGAGCAFRANFYNCDETIHPHFGTWNPVVAPQPDFHRPECFGTVRIEG